LLISLFHELQTTIVGFVSFQRISLKRKLKSPRGVILSGQGHARITQKDMYQMMMITYVCLSYYITIGVAIVVVLKYLEHFHYSVRKKMLVLSLCPFVFI
jgi:hypothetical protein